MRLTPVTILSKTVIAIAFSGATKNRVRWPNCGRNAG
jgi:hypothetical protein